MLQRFAEEGDAIALTLYMEDDDAGPHISETQNYFGELISTFPAKNVLEANLQIEGGQGGFGGRRWGSGSFL